MGERLDSMLFPGGKSKAMTFSYDDGVVQDRRLVEMFNQYAVKGTFNLNAAVLGYRGCAAVHGREIDVSKVIREEVHSLYAGHEVGGHGLTHADLRRAETPRAMYEIIEDRRQLETLTGGYVRMFAYPYGTYDGTVMELLRLAGYAGARTVSSTGGFNIPKDFLEWNPTCHHADPMLMELAERFCREKPRGGPMLFYVWGHAYEFDADGNWDVMESLCRYVTGFRDDIWFASNGEIMDYVEAFRRLIYAADGRSVTNPSALDVWLCSNGGCHKISSGETINVG